jgi:DNA-binding transcriptional ArsR family regulator
MEASTLDALARDMTGLSHPIRIRTLVLLEYEYSPSELAKLINVPIGRVSYHVRGLRDLELITETRVETRRGALEHYYRRSGRGDRLLKLLNGRLAVPERGPGRPGKRRREQLEAWAAA